MAGSERRKSLYVQGTQLQADPQFNVSVSTVPHDAVHAPVPQSTTAPPHGGPFALHCMSHHPSVHRRFTSPHES